MSTILDALRKLQGDRDGLTPPPRRDLRASVLESSLPPVRVQRPEPKVRPFVAAVGGGAIVAACLGAFALWSSREVDPFERAASPSEMQADATLMAAASPPSPPPEPPPPPRAPEPLVNLAAPPEPPPESPEARYAAFQPPPPTPADTNTSSGPMLDAPATFDSVMNRARPLEEDPSQAYYTPPPPENDPTHGEEFPPPPPRRQPQQDEPPRIVTRDSQQAPQPAELENAMERARERLARSEASQAARRPRREQPRREEPRREEPPPEPPAGVVADGVQFPVLEVQSVLWHPDPLRRQATILLDGQLATDAREGDLIGGVFIDRITPGSVEFRMGQERKRVDMAP